MGVLALATRTPIEQESADSGQDKHIARMQAGNSIGDTIEQESVASLACERVLPLATRHAILVCHMGDAALMSMSSPHLRGGPARRAPSGRVPAG